jgi:hypothetical protein
MRRDGCGSGGLLLSLHVLEGHLLGDGTFHVARYSDPGEGSQLRYPAAAEEPR